MSAQRSAPRFPIIRDVRPVLALVALLAFVGGSASAALPRDPFDLGQPFCRPFRDRDGLPQNTVHALLVDRNGFLWAGTQDGAARYDGRSWKHVDLPHRERSNFVRAMLETSDGSLWFGTQAGGLARFRDGEWTSYEPGSSGLPGGRVNALLETAGPDGGRVLWIGTFSSGLVRFDGEAWTVFGTAAGLPSPQVWSLLASQEAGEPVLWVATGNGPARLRLSDGRIETPPGAPASSVSSLIETVGPEGRRTVWMGTYGNGLLAYAGGAWRRFDESAGLPSLFVTDLAASPSYGGEAFWIGTDGGGLALYREGRVEPVDLATQLTSGAVYKILETTADQGARAVWLGTRNNGLIRMSRGYWRTFQPYPETPDVPVAAILQTPKTAGGTELWLGTDGYGLAAWRDGAWRRYDVQSGAIGNDSVTALAETRQLPGPRRLWVGTRNGGLSSFDGAAWRRFDQASGALPNDLVQTLLEAPDERGGTVLWVGTRDGLASFDGRAWRRPDPAFGYPRGSVLAMLATAEPAPRRLWIGTSVGLFGCDVTGCRSWGAGEGLLNPAVQALYARTDAAGKRSLWIGTDGGGVSLLDLDDPTASPRPLATLGGPELVNGTVYAILGDRQQRLYLLTNEGVTRLTPPQPGEPWRSEEFSTEQGLPLNQGNRGAGYIDAGGRIWVGTVGGAAAFDPEREPVDRTPKRLHLEGFPADCESCLLRPRELLEPHRKHLVFRYALLSFFAESQTRYRTELQGYDPQPSGWTAVPQREVTALGPGTYTFRVWGRDAEGNIAGPRELAFVIQPAIWQTTWARALLVAAVLALATLLVRLRTRAHERRERELREMVEAKTRRLQRANSLLVELSYVDALTAVPNRRRFDELLAEEWKRAVRGATPLGLVLIDIDAFKAYNDDFGHREGDECLKLVASVLADGLARSGDAIARYGGEEFAVILPATDSVGALQVAETLRRRVEAQTLPQAGGARRQVTVSCGVAAMVPAVDQESGGLFQRADEALYRAKRAGGNLSIAS